MKNALLGNRPPNIILIMTDQLRSDYVGFSGEGKMETPNIDRIAEGVVFTCCQTVNPICQPARTALATGRYSHQIGTLSMSGDLSPQHPTFMQAIQKAGYKTAAIGKLHYLQPWEWNTPRGKILNLHALNDKLMEYGFDYVWEAAGKQLMLRSYCDYAEYLNEIDLYDNYLDFVEMAGPNYTTPDKWPEDSCKPFPFDEMHYPDIVITDKSIEYMRAQKDDKPCFLMISFLSPHKPFDPPQRYLDQIEYVEEDDFIPGERPLSGQEKKQLYRKRHAYKAMIKLLDDQVGKIINMLETQGLLDNTVLMFSSDHGEMLGDHFRIQKMLPWKESVTVPTAIRHPKYLSGIKNDSPVENIDLAATILDIVGLDPHAALSRKWPDFNNIIPCRSLLPVVQGKIDRIRDYSFSECRGEWQMIQSDQYKYIRHLKRTDPDELIEELYDIKADRHETKNRIKDTGYSEALQCCRRRVEFIMDTTPPAQTSWVELESPMVE